MNDRAVPAARSRGRQVSPDGIIVDPAVPTIRDFLQRSIMDGMIRTVPAGRGRVLILPSAGTPPTEVRPVAAPPAEAIPAVRPTPEPRPRASARPPAIPANWTLAEIHNRVTRLADETADLLAMAGEVRARCAAMRHRFPLN